LKNNKKKVVMRNKVLFVLVVICLVFSDGVFAFGNDSSNADPVHVSTQKQALEFISKIKELEPSPWWPRVKPTLFLQNLNTTINNPMSIYPGRGTNFCGYGALTYLFLQDDPLGYTQLLLALYKNGKASFGRAVFEPSAAIRKQAGQLKYKGILDIRPAEQIWYLTLADHFKGYLNIFNRKYDPGDEDRFWASVNYAKFNRMIRTLLQYKVTARGTDLIRPGIDDLYEYISEKLKKSTVALFINNRIVHKKNHVQIKLAIPTHFIILQQIMKTDDVITLVYWDYGGRTLLQLSPAFLKKIIFGITCCTKKSNDAE
jgi:hypothetical protein